MTIAPEAPATPAPLRFLELEITGRCQLTCASHCYAQAGPTKGHGTMTAADWRRVIDEAAALGVETVQFIGGEATMHPDFDGLADHALNTGLRVQVFSNLYRVSARHWALFERPGLSLATSYYSDDADEHDEITGRTGSHAKTRANIAEAIERGIRLKVGIIHMRAGQRSEEARAEMQALGVDRVHIDRVREVGNAARTAAIPSTSELCGRCADGKAAILPDGTVTPCVLGRFLPTGNVSTSPLAAIFGGQQWAQVAASIPRGTRAGCTPDEDSCMPSPGVVTACNPDQDGSDCSPAETPACEPSYD
ncbi:radical SAM protein [Streptomyces sp. MBT53]|uniref:radical SAM protein n=1 Tax=Streptomyces sp. MBT53 TaxID=1488384 RepID=UPI001912F489|nr:radical SAM protein [Streptomyces sp. MBT53]MBK6015905.1 radical SAM protein [Streptomyces sp. MBT53]